MLGEKKQKEVNKTAINGLILGFIVYFVLLVFGIFGVKWFYNVQTDDVSICNMGYSYLSVICIFSFGQIFQLVLEKLLQSTGRTTFTMITQITGAIINIILDPILIFGYFGFPAMGTKGAAIATVIGQIIAMLLGIIFNLKFNKEIQFSYKNIKLEKYYVKNICYVGIPAGITMFISSIMSFGINKILLGFSTTATAVFGAYSKLYTFVSMAAFGLNNALISIVAYNLGNKKYNRIKQAIKLSGIYSVLIGLIGLVLSLQGLSIGAPSMFISAARQVIILLPAAYCFGKILGVSGVWLAFPITEIIVMIVAIIYLKHTMDKLK